MYVHEESGMELKSYCSGFIFGNHLFVNTHNITFSVSWLATGMEQHIKQNIKPLKTVI